MYPDLNSTSYPNLAKTVFVIFMIFVPILLLNMLIAMMGNTYAHVIEQSEKEWMKQWAKIVVTLERAVPQADAQKYLEQYSIPLGPSDDSGFEQRGVMVIKSKSKTRAKQRKGAVSNWKRVGRVTLTALKKRGMTGEELRRIMWGRASITSPTKISKKKPKDPYNIFGETNSALGAAVDVMSFTHDIVLLPDSEPQEDLFATQPKTKKGAAALKPGPKKQGLIAGSLQGKLLTTTAPAISTSLPGQNDINDPLRELVLISETAAPTDTDYLSNVKHLATQASDLVHAKPLPSAPPLPPVPLGQEITNLSSLFQDPKDIVDPEKEKAFFKQLEALDDTEDSDGFIERPVLGKISLIRRAKSAVSRTSSTKKPNEKHPLFSFAWDEPVEVKGEGSGVDNEAYLKTEEVIQIEEDEGNPQEEEEEEIVTAEDVKRKMEEIHLRHRQINDTDRRQQKSAKIRRPRNKISPETTEDETRNRRAKTAYDSRSRRARMERSESPPDPLEPWSTRELANINKILES